MLDCMCHYLNGYLFSNYNDKHANSMELNKRFSILKVIDIVWPNTSGPSCSMHRYLNELVKGSTR